MKFSYSGARTTNCIKFFDVVSNSFIYEGNSVNVIPVKRCTHSYCLDSNSFKEIDSGGSV